MTEGTPASRRVGVRSLSIETTDVGSGPVVLFMHGVPDTRRGWDRVIDALGSEVRAVAPDFPGFGGSSELPADADLSPDGMSSLWGAFVDEALGAHERVVLVVHDFGGPWMLPWALENRSRVRGLVVLNTLFHADFRWHVFARTWQTPLVGELSMVWVPRPIFAREMRRVSPGIDEAAIAESHRAMHASMRRTTLRVYRALASPSAVFGPWEPRLAAARDTIPTRVVWGDRDPNIPASVAERFGSRVTHLPHDGHFVQLTSPGMVADAIRAVLAEAGTRDGL